MIIDLSTHASLVNTLIHWCCGGFYRQTQVEQMLVTASNSACTAMYMMNYRFRDSKTSIVSDI